MGMKFLNKKGWHTGSLRNIETVWKAEEKQKAEEKKLEELRLQLVQERERSEFRSLQEQAGLIPRQERLDFLYDSGLAVGKGKETSGVSFQREEQPPLAEAGAEKPDPTAPGALFEDKAKSANDSWRKLHSDPLLLIKQREQEALAKIKNNPVKMALIRKSVEEKGKETKKHKKKHRKDRRKDSSSEEEDSDEEKNDRRKISRSHDKYYERRDRSDVDDESKRRDSRDKYYDRRRSEGRDRHYERRNEEPARRESYREVRDSDKYRDRSPRYGQEDRKRKNEEVVSERVPPSRVTEYNQNRRRKGGSKLTEEERAARLKEMQMDAEVHEEQRWRRLKKADETDAVEADKNKVSNVNGKSFLDDANKSVYGMEKGGSSTIEESVRRRSYYSQRGTEAEGNAFRR